MAIMRIQRSKYFMKVVIKMSLTYGFYNSLDHDRKYSALQMGSIFDGIVNDGIYMAIGERMMVMSSSGMTVMVGTGRAWFNHTWTLNDARIPLTIEPAEVTLTRIDLIVLEINNTLQVRANSIKVIKGVPSQKPAWPTIVNDEYVHQHILAAITIKPHMSAIRQADITNCVGTNHAPFVTGIIQTINADSLIAQWRDQWAQFFEQESEEIVANKNFWKTQYETFYANQTETIRTQIQTWIDQWHDFTSAYGEQMEGFRNDTAVEIDTWFNETAARFESSIELWQQTRDEEFLTWFNGLREMLDENAEAGLAAKILELDQRMDKFGIFKQHMEDEYAIYYELKDSNSEPILDSDGRTIDARIIFVIK